MDLNLDTLKRSIADQLAQSDFAVFHHDLGAFDESLVITWDSETYPDFQMFLDAAKKLGVKMLLFAFHEFTEEELKDAETELESSGLSRDDIREYEATFASFRKQVGSTCSIELAFHYETHFYVYEARSDWYDEFIGIVDEINELNGLDLEDDTDDESGSIGGFYSNN